MANIKWNDKDFQRKSSDFLKKFENHNKQALQVMANELLRLSQFEVPHDTGQLQNTGHIEPDGDDYLVGYNKVYALRLHENPQYAFQKGRKGKYLEDPLKNNENTLIRYYTNEMSKIF